MITNITKFTTHYRIQYDEMCYEILDLKEKFTALEYKTEEEIPLAYVIDDRKKEMRVPAGFPEVDLKKILKYNKDIKLGPYSLFDRTEFTMKSQPRKGAQEEILGISLNHLRANTQLTIDANTGVGKTFLACMLAQQLGLKVFVLTLTDKLRKYWRDEFLKHTNLKPHQVVTLEGASAFGNHYEDAVVFISIHHSLRNVMTGDDRSVIMFNQWLVNNRIGMKVFDECDLETKSTFRLDLYTSVLRTLYLSATHKKSSKTEDEVYQNAMKSIKKIGKEFIKTIPDRHCKFLTFNSTPGRVLYARALKFDGDFSWLKHCDYMFMFRSHVLMELVREALKVHQWVIENKDSKAQLLICIPKKDYGFILRDMMVETFVLDKMSIGVINSTVDKKYIDYEKRKPIMISTIKSMGRGVDLPNLMVYLDMEIYVSESMYEQSLGRVARDGGSGYYIGVFDMAYSFIVRSFQIKQKLNKLFFRTFKTENRTFAYDDISREQAKDIASAFKRKYWKYLKDFYAEQNKKKGAKKNG